MLLFSRPGSQIHLVNLPLRQNAYRRFPHRLWLTATWFAIPTRCRYLLLKQIRLVNMIPAILIILIVHIIIAIRWMLIKILSAVINDWEQFEVIVPGGCYLDIIIIRKTRKNQDAVELLM